MLLVVDHQQNYSCAMEDKIDEVRKFAIKHKGKPCEFDKTTNGREQGRVVGYNKEMVLLLLEFMKILDGAEWKNRKMFLFIQDLNKIIIRFIMYILIILL